MDKRFLSENERTLQVKESTASACGPPGTKMQVIGIDYGWIEYLLFHQWIGCDATNMFRWAIRKCRTDPLEWDLLKPVPFDIDARPLETMLGHNSDVHYMHICTKVSIQSDCSLKTDQKPE
uniref:Uncharacterized protein n=1 Tax=Cucumis melo TaxID=3656 RepID=A0A9I9EA48_CUCME